MQGSRSSPLAISQQRIVLDSASPQLVFSSAGVLDGVWCSLLYASSSNKRLPLFLKDHSSSVQFQLSAGLMACLLANHRSTQQASFKDCSNSFASEDLTVYPVRSSPASPASLEKQNHHFSVAGARHTRVVRTDLSLATFE